MYTRPPERARQRVTIPENYSGNAFYRDGSPSNMPPPVRPPIPQKEREQSSSPPLPMSISSPHALDLPPSELEAPVEETPISENKTKADEDSPSPASSAFSYPVLSKLTEGRFPFGHGLGSEELLIMAVMLMIFLSDKEQNRTDDADRDLLAMLGLLLFAG